MRKIATISLLLLSLVGMFLAGSWYRGHKGDTAGPTEGRKVLYYVDPMNPTHTSDKPGAAPCGMAMEPVYADEEASGEDSAHPGTVKISSQKQQLLGVTVSPVEVTSHTHSIRTIGRVAPDETRIHKLIAGAPGFICDLSDATTDDYVTKDQWLASFSSPDSIPSIQSYILALNTLDNMRHQNNELSAEVLEGGATYMLRAEKLVDLGMSRIQMEELKKTRTVPTKIKIYSPIDGFVLSRNVSADQIFGRGEEWYRIADLTHVWVVADVFERAARHIHPGMTARVSIPQRGIVLDATVTRVPPRFDAASRTLKVRLELDNPENVLRPDMIVDVEFPVTTPPALTVSTDAVLDSGARKTVFVELGDGRFEPRTVETGWRLGGQVEIVSGLMPGERIVTSGNFLVDSESRMKLAAAGFHGEVVLDPVCRTDVEVASASRDGLTKEYNGKNYFFCSDLCKRVFEKDPEGVVARASRQGPLVRRARPETTSGGHDDAGYAHDANGQKRDGGEIPSQKLTASRQEPNTAPSVNPQQTTRGYVTDLVCGMPMPEQWAKTKGLTSEYNGRTYFFCSKECRRKFERNPEPYLSSHKEVQPAGTVSQDTGRRP